MRQNTKVRHGVRQGDVLLVPVARERVSGTPVAPIEGRFRLSEGEALGHLHMIDADDKVEMMSDGVTSFVTVGDKPTRLAHEMQRDGDWQQADHNPLKVYGGQDYEVIQQRRVTPSFDDHGTVIRRGFD